MNYSEADALKQFIDATFAIDLTDHADGSSSYTLSTDPTAHASSQAAEQVSEGETERDYASCTGAEKRATKTERPSTRCDLERYTKTMPRKPRCSIRAAQSDRDRLRTAYPNRAAQTALLKPRCSNRAAQIGHNPNAPCPSL